MSLDFIVLSGNESVHLHAKPTSQLTHVLLGHHHAWILAQYLFGILGQGVDILELCHCHLVSCGSQLIHGSMQVSVCTSKSYYEQVGILLVTQNFQVRNGYGVNLCLTLACHQIVVLGIGTDGSSLVVFLQSAQDMLESFSARYGPVSCSVFCTHVWCP